MLNVADLLTPAVRADVTNGVGAVDVSAALNLAFQQTRERVYLPAGRWRIDHPITPPRCGVIEGDGTEGTILMAPTGAGRFLRLVNYGPSDSPGPAYLAGFTLDGSRSSGAIGFLAGDASETGQPWRGIVDRVTVQDFGGDDACGFWTADVVKSEFSGMVLARNTVNHFCKCLATNIGGVPTTITFRNHQVSNAVRFGVVIQSGLSLAFKQFAIEGSGLQGVWINATAGLTSTVLFRHGWFEDNWRAAASGTTNYQLDCIGAGGVTRPYIDTVYFGGSDALRSIRFAGSYVAGYNIRLVDCPNLAGQISIQHPPAYGAIGDWCSHLDQSLVISYVT